MAHIAMLQTTALNRMNPGSTADALFRSCKLDAKNVVGWLMTQNALRSWGDIARSRKRITAQILKCSKANTRNKGIGTKI